MRSQEEGDRQTVLIMRGVLVAALVIALGTGAVWLVSALAG